MGRDIIIFFKAEKYAMELFKVIIISKVIKMRPTEKEYNALLWDGLCPLSQNVEVTTPGACEYNLI